MNNINKLISIIIPVYNGADRLNKCINSIILQTYKNLEIIIVDDGSTDNTRKLCENLCAKDNRIKYIYKKNSGVSDTRNIGLKNANGKYIAFVDSDDYIERNMYEQMIYTIENYNCDLCICNIKKIKNNKEININNDSYKVFFYESLDLLFSSLRNDKIDRISSCWNKLFKAEKVNNLFFESNIFIAEDLLFISKYLLKCQKIAYINSPFYNYIVTDESLSHKISKKTLSAFNAFEMIMDVLNNKINNKNFMQFYKDEFFWVNFIVNEYKFEDTYEKKKFEKIENQLLKKIILSKDINFTIKIKTIIKKNFYKLFKILKR